MAAAKSSAKSTNPMIEPNSPKDTADNIANVLTYLQVAEAALSEAGQICGSAASGRNIIFAYADARLT